MYMIIMKVVPEGARLKGLLAALGGTVLTSFDSVFIRLSGTGGVNTAFLFGFFTMISMAIIIQTKDKRGLFVTLRENGWPSFVSGFLMLGSASSFILSIKHTNVANTMIIMGCQPVFTAILSWIFLKEKTDKTLWAAMLIVVAGIIIVVHGSVESGNLIGDLLAFATVIFLSINRIVQRKYKEISRTAIVGTGGFLISVVMFLFADIESFTAETWIIMGIMGLCSAPLGRVLNGVSTRYILAVESSMITLSVSVFSTLWAFIFFNEIPPFTTLTGGAIIITTISVYILSELRSA